MKRNLMLTEAYINRIVNESINALLYESQWDNIERGKRMVTLPDGTQMTEKDYKKMMKKKRAGATATKKTKKAKKTKKRPTSTAPSGNEVNPNQLHGVLQKFIKIINRQNGVQSLYVFKDHGYKSFGTDGEAIIKLFGNTFNQFSASYIRIQQYLNKIEEYGKLNEYTVYSVADKLANEMEDMNMALRQLYNIAQDKMKFIRQNYGKEAVFLGRDGNRELGFSQQILCKNPSSFSNTCEQIDSIIKEIRNIVDKGRNPLDYDPITGRARA